MRMRKTVSIAILAAAAFGLWLGYSATSEDASASLEATQANGPGITRESPNPFLSSYIVDPRNQIALKDTGLNEQRDDPQMLNKSYAASELVNRGTVDYFRYLQTEFQAGATLQANTEAIRQHLFSTLQPEDAEKLFALYKKFVDFEYSIGDKAKDWKMPESPKETLELIGKMQKHQQQTFGEETADLLFGGELKTMEYTARKSGILNDKVAGGAEKEALLNKLTQDMFGISGDKLDATKNPYNLFEEKLLLYKNDLDKLEPPEAEKLIKQFRVKYLPASANSQ
jgi:hypothetical protein